MKTPGLQELLSVAIEAAYLGGRRTLAYFNADVAVKTKADHTPVTQADHESEKIIRNRIARSFPHHAIIGEEGGATRGHVSYRWIIDPLDGTQTFIRGVPLYGVLVGVVVKGKPSVGVIYLPVQDELVAAADGLGCHWNGRPARVSTIATLKEATLLTTNSTMAMKRSDAYERLAARTRLQRTWGDCYGYALVATGRAEIMLDPSLNLWDCAPLPPILREAGGCFTNWAGESTIRGGDGVATNGVLHSEVVSILKDEKHKARDCLTDGVCCGSKAKMGASHDIKIPG